jgi:hypothetical protein
MVIKVYNKRVYLVFIFTSKLIKWTKNLYNLALKAKS